MPKALPMLALELPPRFYGWVGMLLLGCAAAACDSGVVRLSLLPAAAGGSADASSEAGNGGRAAAGASSRPGESRGGMGGVPRLPTPCGDDQWEPEQEDALRSALSEAFDSGRYCPHLPPQARRPLMADPELQWQARASICFPYTENRGWSRLTSRAPVFAWWLVGTPNLEDAKKALLGAEHEQLCEEAGRNPSMTFRLVGVGHSDDVWSVFIAPMPQEDMQKP